MLSRLTVLFTVAPVSQGEVYNCDFGVERGVELSGKRPALVVSADQENSSGQNVLVVPTTQGSFDPMYLDYYPWLEELGSRASCRNLRTISIHQFGNLMGSATREEMRRVVRGGVWPYLEDSLLHGNSNGSDPCPGTVHRGFIPNCSGLIEESWFLVLASNPSNGFATVVKVDRKPVGLSKVRIPLTVTDGPYNMAAYSHRVQPVDLSEAFRGLEAPGYVGRVEAGSLRAVVRRVMQLTRIPAAQ